jgi:UDP-glucose 4-epimerase
VRSAPRREGDPNELVASSDRARADLGWVPAKPTLHDMIDDAWRFYRSAVA